MIRCESCKGTYNPIQGDMRYFHTCPENIRDGTGKIIPTPNPRDENVIGSVEVNKNKVVDTRKIKLDGAGATDLNTNQPYDLITGKNTP